MVRNVLLAALLTALAVNSGCAAVAGSIASCLPEGQSGHRPAGCHSVRENLVEDAEQDEAARIADDSSYRSARADRVQREAAGPDCAAGNPHACLTAAVYDERHGVAREHVIGEYAVACRAELSFGCFGVARLTDDAVIAAEHYVRACHLGEKQACEVGRASAPERAVELDETACMLRANGACERAAFAYGYGAGVALDRSRAIALAKRGCEQMDANACTLRDDLGASQ